MIAGEHIYKVLLLPEWSTHTVNFKLDWILDNRNKVDYLFPGCASFPFHFYVSLWTYVYM